MPELIAVSTDVYEFVVWSKDVDKSRSRLAKTLEARSKPSARTSLVVEPSISLAASIDEISEIELNQPVFFENKLYDIEFAFKEGLRNELTANNPRIEHRLQAIEEAFHYSKRTNSLRASINTGNDIGWFKFVLVYQIQGIEVRQKISFEVLPTKMDMTTDLSAMCDAIDKEFPLWRYSIAEKTQQAMQSVKRPHPDFLLLWLAQFETLIGELRGGLKHILNAPHTRLMQYQRTVNMEGLKGRLSPQIERKVKLAKANKDFDKRFSQTKKYLSVDTPENRFIKLIVTTAALKLGKVCDALVALSDGKNRDQRLSNSFVKQVFSWKNELESYRRHSLFSEVGKFTEMKKESLVLQQKLGYSKVYKVWQQLKWYLELLGGDSNLSLRSVSELYEIWCFLEVRRILLSIGFEETNAERIPMINKELRVSFKDGMQGTFRFERNDGVKLRLAHEPKFTTQGNPLKSWTTTQKPDIFLEATFSDDKSIVWLFDAKYRINDSPNSEETKDLAPSDAINQMHRYRDALIHVDQTAAGIGSIKSRPVFGAFALYPGFYNQRSEKNPYDKEIAEVGIGAFSLLPSEDDSNSVWLTDFLTDKLSKPNDSYPNFSSDKYFVEEAPRIPYRGTKVTRFDDLILLANQLGPQRSAEYVEKFKSGEASFYHTRQFAFERQNIQQHIVEEARYLGVAIALPNGTREIRFLYPIQEATYVRRKDLTATQTGTAEFKNGADYYWLFKLGSSINLLNTVSVPTEHSFRIKLVSYKELISNSSWNELPEKYASILG